MTTPTTPTTPVQGTARQHRADAYVRRVLALCESKRTRADLRSGLGRPVEQCNYLHRYLVPLLPERMHPDGKRAHYAVAALIAARPRVTRDADTAAAAPCAGDGTGAGAGDGATSPWWQRPNLGTSLAQAVRVGGLKGDSAEGDLHLLTRQSTNAIHPRLPSLTQHLLRVGVAIDWPVLLEDLTWWNRDQDRIATRWLESYFRVVSAEDRTPTVPTHKDPS
ncbi:type I-E CRISPR-associated protein Cse2/CasB [Streptomyces sp. TRM49041]|uniref:type I-E CRISPR-associated protein Cse2/CasB n=1 Tax=Streptomyces sp. TRM49041 TaxID=2603216 RepID=UPI0021CC8FE5|nr:type I-E CRISPR-associated protein Cse2/CasB [Streptomyces sp. TRM49041]